MLNSKKKICNNFQNVKQHFLFLDQFLYKVFNNLEFLNLNFIKKNSNLFKNSYKNIIFSEKILKNIFYKSYKYYKNLPKFDLNFFKNLEEIQYKNNVVYSFLNENKKIFLFYDCLFTSPSALLFEPYKLNAKLIFFNLQINTLKEKQEFLYPFSIYSFNTFYYRFYLKKKRQITLKKKIIFAPTLILINTSSITTEVLHQKTILKKLKK
jgi:hypothetical protein